MALTGDEGSKISLATAEAYTAAFREEYPERVRGFLFGIRKVLEVIGQPGVLGMRIYQGVDGEGKDQVILVGTDREGNDLTSGILMDVSIHCPPVCGNANGLNGE